MVAVLRELAYAEEDAQRALEFTRIATQVREQAGENVFPLTLLDGRVVQVPRAPFMHWALSRVPDLQPTLPAWEPVSPSGVKLQNDDPCHTDWVLGAGLSIEESYTDNVSKPAWTVAADMQFDAVDHD